VKLGALTIFAYDSEDVKGSYSAGRLEYAPEGKWEKANPKIPVSKWEMKIDFAEFYFAPKPTKIDVGVKVVIADPDSPTVGISKKVESWGDSDLIANVPRGTKATVLEVKEFSLAGGYKMIRYRVKTDKGVTGWVNSEPVKLP
jgi:hypothetical protein